MPRLSAAEKAANPALYCGRCVGGGRGPLQHWHHQPNIKKKKAHTHKKCAAAMVGFFFFCILKSEILQSRTGNRHLSSCFLIVCLLGPLLERTGSCSKIFFMLCQSTAAARRSGGEASYQQTSCRKLCWPRNSSPLHKHLTGWENKSLVCDTSSGSTDERTYANRSWHRASCFFLFFFLDGEQFWSAFQCSGPWTYPHQYSWQVFTWTRVQQDFRILASLGPWCCAGFSCAPSSAAKHVTGCHLCLRWRRIDQKSLMWTLADGNKIMSAAVSGPQLVC